VQTEKDNKKKAVEWLLVMVSLKSGAVGAVIVTQWH